MFPDSLNLSIRAPVNEFIQALVTNYGWVFKAISGVILKAVLFLEWILRGLPWWLVILAFMALAWQSSKRWTLTLAVGVLLLAVGVLGLWDLTMQTLALMLMATIVSVVIGVPIGILVAKSRVVRNVTLPVLDVMQTMPSFVYLIPALMLFGLGKVPAILATIIYAVPPLIRLTDLGIRQVDGEVVEAATAFGGSPTQILFGVELPLATPTIMAGLNQTIMMALSMVVVASMIGARGLGEQVLNGIQTLDVGKGLEAGIGIVILQSCSTASRRASASPGRRTPAMADIEIRNVYKIFGHDATKALAMVKDGLDKADILARSGCSIGLNDVKSENRRRQDFRDHGVVRIRQVDFGAPHQPVDRTDERRGRLRRQQHPRPRREGAARLPHAASQHGLPELRPDAAPDRAAECRLRPARARRLEGRCPRDRHEVDRDGRSIGLRCEIPAPALGRHEAARRASTGARRRYRRDPDGRGLQRPRSADPQRHAGPVAATAAESLQRPSSSSPTISTRRCASDPRSPS